MQDEGDLHLAVACLGTRILFPDWSCIFLSVKFVEKVTCFESKCWYVRELFLQEHKEHKTWIADNTVIVCYEQF
jgi:hypothetical protein